MLESVLIVPPGEVFRRMSAATSMAPVMLPAGHRHRSRMRSLMGSFGKTEIAVPRARP
jgi:hypothetical protein